MSEDAPAATEAAPEQSPTLVGTVVYPGRNYKAIVAAWFNANIANSPASRDVQVVNYLNQTAIPALVAFLQKD